MLTCLSLTHRVLQDKTSFGGLAPNLSAALGAERGWGEHSFYTESASSQAPTKPHSWGQQAAVALRIGTP